MPTGNPQLGQQTLNGIVFATGEFVAIGDSGVVSISVNGTNWSQSATATTNDLNGIVYAGGEFVAVGNNGVVETSADGTNWALQNSGTTNSLSAIAYGNGKFVAVGLNAVIVSSNAVNWSPATSGLPGATTIAFGPNGFVALLQYGYVTQAPHWVYFSTDGLTWTTESFPDPDNPPQYYGGLYNDIVTYWNGAYFIGAHQYVGGGYVDLFIFSSADGSNWNTNRLGTRYLIAGSFSYGFFMNSGASLVTAGAMSSLPFMQFTSDGLHWSETDDIPYGSAPNSEAAKAGAYGNGVYVVLGPTLATPAVYTSSNGLNWSTNRYVPPLPSGPSYTFTGIASNNSVDVVVSGNLIVTSSNGLSYAAASNTPALSSVTAFNNQFIGVGASGTVYVTTNGSTWIQRTSVTANSLHAVTVGNGLLVAVGDGGTIQTSSSGFVWTIRTSGTSLPLYGVASSNGVLVAVGQEGTVVTSPDGVNWTGQYSGVLSNLLSVAYGSAGFVAVGPGGTVVSSPDGVNWNIQSPGTAAGFESISFGNGYYLAVGDKAVAMTSPDAVTWTTRNLGATGGQNFYGSAFINNHFDVVGANGTILESDPITPLFNLQLAHSSIQNAFTIYGPAGASFRLQSCTSLSLSNWTDVTTFNNFPGVSHWTNSTTGNNQSFYRLVSP